jgi:hypothetical protein
MTFSGFGAYQLDAGGSWTLAGTSTLGADKSLADYADIDGALSLGAASDRLILGAGGSISGAVAGGGGSLELASGAATLTGLGAAATLSGDEAMSFSGFGAYQLDAGGSLTLEGSNALALGKTLTADGSLTVAAGASLAHPGKLNFGDDVVVTNFGTITGGLDLDGADDRLVAEAGSKLGGAAVGNGGTLELGAGSGTITGLGAGGTVSGAMALTFRDFDAYQLDAGGSWTLAGAATLAAGQTLTDFGTITGGLTLGAPSAGLVLGAGASIGGAVAGGGGTLGLESGTATLSVVGAVGTLSGSEAVTFSGFGAYQLGGTLINTGALGAGLTLTSPGARLIADNGSTFAGVVEGGGGTLELGPGAGTITNLGASAIVSGGVAMSFSGFGAYQLDAGGSWTLAGTRTLAAGQTLTDYGTITNGPTLGAASDRLILGAGASIRGAVKGGGGTLELASGEGTITGLGGTAKLSGSETMSFSGFGSYQFDAGGTWTISGDTSFGAGQSLTDDGALTNLGTLANTYGAGATLGAGSVLTNGDTSDTAAMISGYVAGVYAGAGATVTNLGEIQGYEHGIQFQSGGTVINGSASDTGAFIQSKISTDVDFAGAAGTVTNYGAIINGKYGYTRFGANAVNLSDGGQVTNGGNSDTAALIYGYDFGVACYGAPAILANYGSVGGTVGVVVNGGGDVTNGSASDSSARISGLIGVIISGPVATTLTNFGVIDGRGPAGVELEDSSDVLVVEAGSKIIGGAYGGGGTLMIGSGGGTISGLGSKGTISGDEALNFGGFGSYVIEAGGSWTFKGVNVLSAGQSLTVGGEATNLGLIESAGDAIVLTAGASLANASKAALISGLSGVYAGGAASVGNSGTILAIGSSFLDAGVDIQAGGTVTNGSKADTTALIEAEGAAVGVLIEGGAGSVANCGTVDGGGYGVVLTGGGSVINGPGGLTGALIYGARFGVILAGDGTVTNGGTISGYTGMYLIGGGSVTNGSASDTSALILASTRTYADHAFGVVIGGGPGTVTNFGTVKGGLLSVEFGDGGVVTNGSNADTSAYMNSVYADNQTSSVTMVTNFGTIHGVESYFGNQTITNGSASDTHALIEFGNSAISAFSHYSGGDLIKNFGTIIETSLGDDPAILARNSTIINGSLGDTTALIKGDSGVGKYFVENDTLTNFGTIVGSGAGKIYAGVSLNSSTITNGAKGDTVALIKGYFGVTAYYSYTTLTNYGTIEGTGGTAVKFNSASNTLVVESGSRFIGAAQGDGGTLVLASGQGSVSLSQTAYGLNEVVSGSMDRTVFSDFATVEVGPGATFTVTNKATTAAGQSLAADGGSLTFAKAITGAGAIEAGAKGTLVVDASAAATLAMSFTGAGATLALASASKFAATVSGFAASDVIDLLAVTATSATLGAGDLLTIMDGGVTVATLQLAGDYTGDAFSVASDHHSGTDVTDNAPGLWPTASPPRSPSASAAKASTAAAALADAGLPGAHGIVQAMAGMGAAAPASTSHGADVWLLQPAPLMAPR